MKKVAALPFSWLIVEADMKIKVKLLQQFMTKKKMSAADLAEEMEVDISEVEKLLNGEAIDKKTAQKFIRYFGVDKAVDLIDWNAIGRENPFVQVGVTAMREPNGGHLPAVPIYMKTNVTKNGLTEKEEEALTNISGFFAEQRKKKN